MLRIELLRKGHRREDFDCGKPPLNEWLQRFALQQQDKNHARTRVVVDAKEPGGVLGYYSLLPYQLGTQHFTAARKLPRRLPCLLLGKRGRSEIDGARDRRLVAGREPR